jgi:alpha-L-rhamnosidase
MTMIRVRPSRLAGLALVLLGTSSFAHARDGGLRATHLRADALVDPLMTPGPTPTLSWQVLAGGFDRHQAAYRIIVSSSRAVAARGRGDLWDSGRVENADSLHAVYEGVALQPGHRAYWRVRIWDRASATSAWSDIAMFGAPLGQKDWQDTNWIGLDELPKHERSANDESGFGDAVWISSTRDLDRAPPGPVVLGTTFELPGDADVVRAELCITADDRFECAINGKVRKGGGNWRVAHLTDVTEDLRRGANTLRVRVVNDSPGPTGLLLRLHVTLADGRSRDVVTTDRWTHAADGADSTAPAPDEAKAIAIAKPGRGPWSSGVTLPPQCVLQPARYLRRAFTNTGPIDHATLYITCLGFADAYLNGERITHRFISDWTDYHRRVYAHAFDVTEHIRAGENALGIVLADGWFSGYLGYGRGRAHYGAHPRVAARLVLQRTDGSRDVVTTGPDWRANTGPIRFADLFTGETYDNTISRTDGFSEPGFDDADWLPVATGSVEVNPVIEPSPSVPIDAFHEFEPVAITQPRDGTFVVDLGRNFAGVVRLRLTGRPGQRVTLRHGERLNPDGTLYTDNLRFALATDTYVCRGTSEEIWEPRFTFHGFQYVEITGLDARPAPGMITGVAIGSLTPDVGAFECSSEMLDRLAQNVYWTQRANFISIPTDCPQRNERLGWTGDAQVYARSAGLNCDVQVFFRKWLVDLIDATRDDGCVPKFAPVIEADGGADGGPAWADAATIVPWAVYWMYDDLALLARQYDNMRGHVDFNTRRAGDDRLPPATFHAFGDWLNVRDPTPPEIIFMAYWAQSTRIVARTARLLGRDDDARHYEQLLREIIDAFNRAYVTEDGRVHGESQTAYVLALRYGLIDPARRDLAVRHLVDHIEARGWHLSTGFVGTRDLMLTLSAVGRHDVALRLALNEDYPSWGFTIRHGATSIWERWDGWTPERGFQDAGMNSFAHYAFGAVYQWMVEQIGGIQIVEPGYRTFRIAPAPGAELTHATVNLRSVQGSIESHWELHGERLAMRVAVPANTRCEIVVPTEDPSSITVNGRDLDRVDLPGFTADGATLTVGSGVYEIRAVYRSAPPRS